MNIPAIRSPQSVLMAGGNTKHSQKTSEESEKYDRDEYIVSRSVQELETLRDMLDLTDGNPDIIQLGGTYRDVTKLIKGKGYEAHHIPAQSVFDEDGKNLPTIAITIEDHKKTSSYAGRMGKRYNPILPGNSERKKHKESIIELLQKGFLPEIVRDEIYEFRRDFGTKYDGGIKSYLGAMIEYIRIKGMPKSKEPLNK